MDRSLLQVQSGQWDNLHVWAPSVILNPTDRKYYMFYTGVTQDTIKPGSPGAGEILAVQRIGVATSLNLDSWTHEDTWVFSSYNAPWVVHDTTQTSQGYSPGWQFRDPWVMPAPDTLGDYLMYYVAIDSALGQYAVGVARSKGNLHQWRDIGPLLKSRAAYTNAGRVESPLVYSWHGKWWLHCTSASIPGRNTDVVNVEINATSPVNPDSSTWTSPNALYNVACDEKDSLSSVYNWHATEYLRYASDVVSHEYLAAYSDLTQSIDFTKLQLPPSSCTTDSIDLDCVSVAAVGGGNEEHPRAVHFALAGPSPAHGAARFRVELPTRSTVNMAVYDVSGRRVKTLFEGWAAPGVTLLTWDGRRSNGTPVGSGVYFARLTWAGGRSVVRLPLIR